MTLTATRSVTVTGVGAVSVPRDTAIVRVAAVHRASALADALAGAESARALLVEVARRYVAAEAVASESLDLWPVHDNTGHPVGFDARHALTVRCTDLAVAGALLTALASEVGDRLRVDGVSLTAGATGAAQQVARERALGEVLAISDGTPGPSGARANQDGAAEMSVGFESGQADVAAAVSVTWALR